MFLIFLYEKIKFKNNNSKNETKFEFDFDFEVGDECENNSYIDDGFICCNYSICDEYCYKNICIPSNKIWFCYKTGILWAILLKHFLTLVFLIFSVIIRLCYHSKKEILIFILYYIANLFSDIFFSFCIIMIYCAKYGEWEFICALVVPVYIFMSLCFAFACTDIDNIYIKKLLTKESYSFPPLRIISFYLFRFGMFIVHLCKFRIVIDIYMYIISNKYREDWQAFNTIKVEDGGYEEEEDILIN